MNPDKMSRAIRNCYLTALIYAALSVAILVLRHEPFTDRFTFLYALNGLGMTLLFISFPFTFRGRTHRGISITLRLGALISFLGSMIWLVSIILDWYKNEITFRFNVAALAIYVVGLALSFLVLFAKTAKLGKELRDSVDRVNTSAIRNFITASIILTFLQVSLLFRIDFTTHLVGALAFAIIMADQSVNITRWFMHEPRRM